jgi:hypothetical protein
MLQRMIVDPEGFNARLKSLVPRMFFALLPFYAAVLALFYRRRNYPEHLYFAIHLHAFVFLALMLAELTKISGSVKVAGSLGVLVLGWIAVYSLIALRRVYGGGWAGTILKGIGIMLLYGAVAIPVMILTMSLAALI